MKEYLIIILAPIATIIVLFVLYSIWFILHEFIVNIKNKHVLEFMLHDKGYTKAFSELFFVLYKYYMCPFLNKSNKKAFILESTNRPEFKNTFYALYKKLTEAFTEYYFSIICMSIMLSPAYCNTYDYDKFIECVSYLRYMKSAFIPISTAKKIYEICNTSKNTYKNEALFYNRIFCYEEDFNNNAEVFKFCINICDEIIYGEFIQNAKNEMIIIKDSFSKAITEEVTNGKTKCK